MVTPNQLWKHVEQISSSEAQERPAMRQWNIVGLLKAGGIAASVLAATAGGYYAWNARDQAATVQPLAEPAAVQEAGPKVIYAKDSQQIPVVEAHDVFSVQ